jgi:hypothetical protein
MPRFIIVALFLLPAFPAHELHAQDLVAVVDLEFLKETDQVAGYLCLGEDNCFPWAHHYLWEAKIRKVISGTESEERFLVVFGAHALKKQDLQNIAAIMKKLEPGAYGDARYQILEWGDERQLVCFDSSNAPQAPLKLTVRSDILQGCYETGEDSQ